MESADYPLLIAIARKAAVADGHAGPAEQAAIDRILERIGQEADAPAAALDLSLAEIAGRFSDEEARRLAYETALTVCNADGSANLAEQTFLDELRDRLGLGGSVGEMDATAGALASADIARGGESAPRVFDEMILQQAMLAGALELLPDRLATIAVLPVQLRMVYQIGQGHGQKLDAAQAKDLAATMGLGLAAQTVERVVTRAVGGLLGGMLGGASRVAGSAAITFAATYALGHAANQYYAQGRKLNAADLKALFTRFQGEARTIFPRVQQQIQEQSRGLNLAGVMEKLGRN